MSDPADPAGTMPRGARLSSLATFVHADSAVRETCKRLQRRNVAHVRGIGKIAVVDGSGLDGEDVHFARARRAFMSSDTRRFSFSARQFRPPAVQYF